LRAARSASRTSERAPACHRSTRNLDAREYACPNADRMPKARGSCRSRGKRLAFPTAAWTARST
jgi:hypothetical protein